MTQENVTSRVVVYCGEGVGRSVLTHAALLTMGLPGIEIAHAGIGTPKSGRRQMNPLVIETAQRRFDINVSKWQWHLLTTDMVDRNTLTVGVTDLPAPDYVREGAGHLLAPIVDPAGTSLREYLEVTASQAANIAWLICLALTTRSGEIGRERDSVTGLVKTQHLMTFQPRPVEPEYEMCGFLFPGQVSGALLREMTHSPIGA